MVYPGRSGLLITFKSTKDQLEKYQEKDRNMENIMTQHCILTKNLMGDGARNFSVVGEGCVNPDMSKVEAFYNEKVNFLDNKGGEYHANYPKQVLTKLGTGMCTITSGVIEMPLGRTHKREGKVRSSPRVSTNQ